MVGSLFVSCTAMKNREEEQEEEAAVVKRVVVVVGTEDEDVNWSG